MRGVVIGVVMCTVVLGTAIGSPAGAAEKPYRNQLGWGVATVGANLMYMPLKLTYATVGGVIGGLAYAVSLGSVDINSVWSPVLGGTYVLTPGMVRGEEPILFFGETVERD